MITRKRKDSEFNFWWIGLALLLAWMELDMMTGWGFIGALLCLVLSVNKND